MTLLQYKTGKRSKIQSKVFINQYFAEKWVDSCRDYLQWWSYSNSNKIVSIAGEILFDFVESERTY